MIEMQVQYNSQKKTNVILSNFRAWIKRTLGKTLWWLFLIDDIFRIVSANHYLLASSLHFDCRVSNEPRSSRRADNGGRDSRWMTLRLTIRQFLCSRVFTLKHRSFVNLTQFFQRLILEIIRQHDSKKKAVRIKCGTCLVIFFSNVLFQHFSVLGFQAT